MHQRFLCLALLALLTPIGLLQAQTGCYEKAPTLETDDGPQIRANFLRLEYPRDFPLSDAARSKLETDIRNQSLIVGSEVPDSWWWEDRVDRPIREALRDEGYFKAEVHTTPYLVRATTDELQFFVSVQPEPGPQYRLGKLQFLRFMPENGTGGRVLMPKEAVSESPEFSTDFAAVTVNELRDQFQMHPGDILNVSKIRDGLEGISKLYGRLGYVAMNSEPDTTVDEKQHVIDLLVRIEEGKQYRLKRVEILGLDTKNAASLESFLQAGQVFNRDSMGKLLEESKSFLRADVYPDRIARISRNAAEGTIGIVLDFRGCSQM